MNTFKFLNTIALTLLFVSLPSTGSEGPVNGDLKSIQVKSSVASTIASIPNAQGQWFTYRVEMEPNNGMPCCLVTDSTPICNLDKRVNNWSSSAGEHEDSKTLNIYFKVDGQQPSDLFYAGSECKIDANGNTVFEMNDVTQEQSIVFLNDLISHDGNSLNGGSKQVKRNKHIVNKALAGVAMHAGSKAQEVLEGLSKGDDKRLRNESIFWLGQARNKAGYESLLGVIDDGNRDDKVRAHAVFALSVNSYDGAADTLVEFGKNHSNEKVQAESIFWLAQHHQDKAGAVIQHVLSNSNKQHVKKKAVFSLSQIETQASWDQLVSLAQSRDDRTIQEEAVFWLSQNSEKNPVSVLMGLIEGENPKSIKDKAIFSLSQLPPDQATPALIQLTKTGQDKSLRKKAIFWLGQSEDPKSIEFLEDVFTCRNSDLI